MGAHGRGAVMSDFISNYWSFLLYLALVSFLAVMSIRETPVKADGEKTTG
jgi:hypothetical protein